MATNLFVSILLTSDLPSDSVVVIAVIVRVVAIISTLYIDTL